MPCTQGDSRHFGLRDCAESNAVSLSGAACFHLAWVSRISDSLFHLIGDIGTASLLTNGAFLGSWHGSQES